MRVMSLTKNKKPAALSVLSTLVLWIVLLAVTYKNNLPGDGAAYLGFPTTILTVEYNPLVDEYAYQWSLLGLASNVFFIVFCAFIFYYLFRRLKR